MLSNTLFTLGALAFGTANALLTNVTIFDPPANYTVPRTLYARTLLLNQDCETSNVLLATWENYLWDNDTNPYFPIYQSLDLGETWTERSRVYDQVNGWGLRYQPFLYELAEAIGNFSAGTILLAGNSIPEDLSETQIDLYASTDKGYSWTFVSHIAHGGEALPDNGLTPVWEPFLMLYVLTASHHWAKPLNPHHANVCKGTRASWWHTTPTNATPPTARNSSTRPPPTCSTGRRLSTTWRTGTTLSAPA